MTQDDYIQSLKDRIRTLEDELLHRPRVDSLEHLRERVARKERMYEVVLARNVILKRKLDELSKS